MRTDDARVAQAETILNSLNPVDTRQRRQEYEAGGWSEHDPNSKGFTAEEIRRERERYLNR